MTALQHPYRAPDRSGLSPPPGGKSPLETGLLVSRLVLVVWAASRLAMGASHGFDVECAIALAVLVRALLWLASD
jgi:hypothetical protein